MGYSNFPVYGEDLGSAVENAEKVIAKIKTNKFDCNDLMDLADELNEILDVIEEEIKKNEDKD